MTKKEFIRDFADNAGITITSAGVMVNAMMDCLTKNLRDHEDIELRGFGTFKAEYKEDAVKRNPMSGEDVFVPAHYTVKFKPSSRLRKAVR